MAGRTPVRPDQVGVVVLAFDAPAGVLEESVDSVVRWSPVGTRLIVVDNGEAARSRLNGPSRHGSIGDAAQAGEAIAIIESPSNGGYGAGMNLGMHVLFEGGCQVVVLLNDDVTVGPLWLEPLLEQFDHADVAAAQPLLVQRGDNEAPATVNSAGVLLDAAGAGSDRLRGAHVAPIVAELDAVRGSGEDIEVFTGGAVALHREAIASVGGFDERFFLYYEDVELARRLRRAGWRCRYVPRSQVTHRGSATAATLGLETRRLQERNRLWSTAMHGSIGEVSRGLWLSVRRLRHEPRQVHRRALAGGVAGMPARFADRFRQRHASDAQDLVKVCR